LKTTQYRLQAETQMLALVPHRDTRLPLRAWNAALFASGLPGAWSFPLLAPIAVLCRPLAAPELKSLTGPIREHIGKNGGKFAANRPACAGPLSASGNRQVYVCGLELEPGFPAAIFSAISEAVITPIQPLVIGAAISEFPSFKPQVPCPQISFRAAALANMSYRILSSGSDGKDSFFCEWTIGELRWLAKKIRN
jgi:hypothetical protein